MKKIFIAALATAVAISLTGCKGTNEKRGDEHLKEGRFRNAINSYLEAKKKGKMSDEFFDNFTLALVRAGEAESKKDLNSDLINNYFEKAAINIPQVKENSTIEEYVKTLADIGKRQAAQEGVDYATIINAFAKIDSAESVAKIRHVAESDIKNIRSETEKIYVARNLSEATSEEDPVVSEYLLLRMAEMAPNNADIQAALNKSRKTTRGYFLIFGENIPDLSGKQRVDKWGYVMAMPTIKMTKNSLSGELQFWASTGNNTELDPSKIKLVSTDGKEVFAKGDTGWCEAEVLVGKKGDEKIEKKQKKFKGKGKLMNEFQCSVNISFSFPGDFVPDYIEYKDNFGIGRKFLGH
jgi:tetratricopeptide (TPR) repeat protein